MYCIGIDNAGLTEWYLFSPGEIVLALAEALFIKI